MPYSREAVAAIPASGVIESAPMAAAINHRHIPSLDGLRAISVMMVFVSHAGLDAVVPGGLGVTVFFFLSGFLITTLMRAEYERNGCVNLGHFWLRRALRILPPFYLVLFAAIVATALLESPQALSWRVITAQLLHLTNYWTIVNGYDGQPMGTGVYWSLAVEEHFYLLFPFCYIAMRKLDISHRNQAILLWSLCAIVLLWRCVLVLKYHVPTNRTYFATDTRVDSILFGCALAVWRNPVLDRQPYSSRQWQQLWLPLAGVLALGSLLIRSDAFRETIRYSLQGVALTPVFIAAIRMHDTWPFRILNARALVFIGTLSYSLYLVHLMVIFALQKCFPKQAPLALGMAALLLSIMLAWVMHLCVEKPCARLRRKLMD
jgi:peptidoglycan/LPS O-acetylase OafA/YrhL